jgi:hypothetical protein
MPLPNFIIIGETKCGTSSLYEDLVKHPDILVSKGNGDKPDYDGGQVALGQKEIRFFDRYWANGFDWYKSCFPEVKSEQITGEASPTYLHRTLSMNRIAKYLPKIKLIIMLRNPIDRVYSHFYHIAGIVPKWRDRYPTFETFLDTAHENDYYILQKGLYIEPIRRCRVLFNWAQVHIIRSEDMFEKPDETYNKVLCFLKVSSYTPDTFSHLRGSGFKTPMTKMARKRLADFYTPYNQQLCIYLNRDMGWE